MIDGSKKEPPFCVRTWLKKIAKKYFPERCRLKIMFAEGQVHFLQENNDPFLIGSVC